MNAQTTPPATGPAPAKNVLPPYTGHITQPNKSSVIKPKPKQKPTPAKKPARTPRKIDPGIAAIHAKAKEEVAQYRKTTASGRILKTIVEKRLAQLTLADRQKLLDELAKTCTPPLFQK